MLKLLMDAAIHWMKAGLPLRSLRIVIFSRNIDNISKADQPLFDLFQKLKDNHEQEEKQNKEVGACTDLKIDWIWHLLLKIEAGVIGPTFFYFTIQNNIFCVIIPFTPL